MKPLIAYIFLKKWTPKDVLGILQNKDVALEHPLEVMLKGSQTILKSFLSDFSITLREMEFEVSLLVISETLGLFVNTLSVNNMSSVRNSENLEKPVQMQLSKKQKPFLILLLHL